MKFVLAVFCFAYIIFFSLLYIGVIRFEVQEKNFLVIAGLLTMLFCFSILALIFIARSMLIVPQKDYEPTEAEEETFEIEEDQPEQLTDEFVLTPNVDIRIQEHRRPTYAKVMANRGGVANKKYMNTPTR